MGIDEKEIEEVLTVATDRHPKCLELWMARLKLSFSKDTKAKVTCNFCSWAPLKFQCSLEPKAFRICLQTV